MKISPTKNAMLLKTTSKLIAWGIGISPVGLNKIFKKFTQSEGDVIIR